jgi:exodeoxyribonuclease VII large subunit
MPNDAATNLAEFTVSELAFAIKRTVEDAYGYVRLRGEISGYRGPHASGHCYFTLKDDKACIDAVVWKQSFRALKFKPEQGLEIVATGRVSTYPGSSKYQIVIEQIEPAGVGALMALLEERKKKLAAEVLFDAARKRPLPYLPRAIGIVTSPTGAVIRDILHRLADRFPRHVLVAPARVQGEGSAAEVVAAIEGLNALAPGGAVPRPDLIIVARGGGSFEDLWGFNDEAVVRAVAASAIPVISAIGHETDWTLIDLVADHRAPTPTAAAERAVPVRADLISALAMAGGRLTGGFARSFDRRRELLRALRRGLPRLADMLALPRQRFDGAAGRLPRALRGNAAAHHRLFDGCAARLRPQLLGEATLRRRERLDGLDRRTARALAQSVSALRAKLDARGKLLDAYSHVGVLDRGYALVYDGAGEIVREARAISPGDVLALQFRDGRVDAEALASGKPRTRPKRSADRGGQGTLL